MAKITTKVEIEISHKMSEKEWASIKRKMLYDIRKRLKEWLREWDEKIKMSEMRS
jgi:gas vesicle protein